MLLPDGTLFGPYRIVAPLGAGGMGEVYRAHDARLNRDVALKILRPEFAEDDDRLQRFAREAQALAALNHPHIAQIHGIEEADISGATEDRAGRPLRALVMELVEGEDLADHIANGPLPLDEALAIARQIAEALEAAHEQGVVHRDLKPANVKIRRDGTVKVLDFGLAKAIGSAGVASQHPLGDSPTFTSPAVTRAGVILGTAAYMSPEQARGRPIDKRADIWAFGVVLFEMLTGRAAYAGETVTDVLAAIVTRDPDWSALPENLPPAVRHLLERCLVKDARLRLRDIGEARVALISVDSAASVPLTPAVERRTRRGAWTYVPWTIAGIAVIAAVAAWLLEPPLPVAPRRLELALPVLTDRGATLAPDGRHIAFRSRDRIAVVDLERAESRDLATSPPSQRNLVFWSPDSAFVGYNDADGKLWTVPVEGGTPRLVCDIPETRQLMGAAWHANGQITFAVWRGGLYQVAAAGGKAMVLAAVDSGKEVDFHNTVALPDGRVLVATHLLAQEASSEIYRIELIGNQQREVVGGSGYYPVAYLEAGYLLLHRIDANMGLWAVRFDGRLPLRLEEAFIVAPGGAFASVARDGSLLYSVSSTAAQIRDLVWVDRTGQITGPLGSEHVNLVTPVLSPDDLAVAFSARTGDNAEIWVRDLRSSREMRITTEATDQWTPAWFPSGRRIAYSEVGLIAQARIGVSNADGSGGRQEFVTGFGPAISPDGRYITYFLDERGENHLRYSSIEADGAVSPATPLLKRTPEPSAHGVAFSPDGNYIAYTEQQPGGAMEVFVTSFPTGEGRWQVSSGGGRGPVWLSTELIFASGSGDGPKTMMAAPVKTTPSLAIGSPIKLFDVGPDLEISPRGASFDATADGKRFVMVRSRRQAGAPSPVRWILAQNWLNDVAAR